MEAVVAVQAKAEVVAEAAADNYIYFGGIKMTKFKMKKLQLISILVGAVLVISLLNTYMIFGLGQQIGAQGGTGLAGAGLGDGGTLKPADPLGGGNGDNGSTDLADDDPFLGPKDAVVTVVEFSDFQCPYCAAAMDLEPSLVARFKQSNPSWEAAVPKLKELAREGKIKFVYRDFPLSGHANAQKAAEATECANEQGKFWEMHDKLFANYNGLSIASIKQFAKDLGLNSAEFDQCLDSGQMAAEVKKDLADGQAAGVSGTPAFFINGQLVSGAQPFSAFEPIINAELAKGGN